MDILASREDRMARRRGIDKTRLASPQDIAPGNPDIAPMWFYSMGPEPPLYFCCETTIAPSNLPADVRKLHAKCVYNGVLWFLAYVHEEEGQPPLDVECWRIFACEVCSNTFSIWARLS